MNPTAKLVAFAGALAVMFGAAYGVGSAADPIAAPETAGHGEDDMAGEEHAEDVAVTPVGLAVSDRGYTLDLLTPTLGVGTPTIAFRITGPDGMPVQDFRVAHDKELHLVVVRRDLTGFSHVHPTRDEAGVWSIPLTLRSPGTYRVFADFEPTALDGDGVTLGADLLVPGAVTQGPLPAPGAVAVMDGYEVSLAAEPLAGKETDVTLTVRRGGEPVTDLEPYLGALGHLVTLRAGDVGYLHSHPLDNGSSGPQVRFATTFPTAGRYALYLDFQHDGVVRTAQFVVDVPRDHS